MNNSYKKPNLLIQLDFYRSNIYNLWFVCFSLLLQLYCFYNEGKKKGRDSSPKQENDKSDQEAMGRKRVKTTKELSVLPQFSDTDVSHIKVEGDLFKNCEFYFVNNDNVYGTKSQLEELVWKHGGSKVQNFLMTNTHIIASQ